MKRRTLLSLGASAAFVLTTHRPAVMAADKANEFDGLLLADLEPDHLWSIYRRYRLLIVGQRDDEIAVGLAGAVADVLARFLPTSRAQLARAVDTRRVGVLIATNQKDVAIMTAKSAEALFLAKPPFDDVRELPIKLIVSFGDYVLVCRKDFMDNHAYLLAQTLTEHSGALPTPARAPDGVIPAHQGSLAFFSGEELPAPVAEREPSRHPHRGAYT
jgi:hypothetical protein